MELFSEENRLHVRKPIKQILENDMINCEYIDVPSVKPPSLSAYPSHHLNVISIHLSMPAHQLAKLNATPEVS